MLNRAIRWAVGAGGVCLAIACAAPPSGIQPIYVSERNFEGWDCEKLTAEYREISGALAAACERQRTEANQDAVGVLLFGIPVGPMGAADLEPQIAHYKGMRVALEAASDRRDCRMARLDVSRYCAPRADDVCEGLRGSAQKAECRRTQEQLLQLPPESEPSDSCAQIRMPRKRARCEARAERARRRRLRAESE